MVEDLSPKGGIARTQPLLTNEHGSRKFGEVAGSTTAEFAAVFCCPCALLNLAVLAFVKLPVGLCRKAWRKRKSMRRKKTKAVHGKDTASDDSDMEDFSGTSSQDELLTSKHNVNGLVMEQPSVSTEKFWEEVVGKSYVGFWRNLSNREQTP